MRARETNYKQTAEHVRACCERASRMQFAGPFIFEPQAAAVKRARHCSSKREEKEASAKRFLLFQAAAELSDDFALAGLTCKRWTRAELDQSVDWASAPTKWPLFLARER